MKIGNELTRVLSWKKEKEIANHGTCLVQIGDFKYSGFAAINEKKKRERERKIIKYTSHLYCSYY